MSKMHLRLPEWIDNADASTVERALNELPARQREIITARHFAHRTLRDLAAEYGVTIERVRQLQMKALNRLSSPRFKERLGIGGGECE